MTNGWTAPQQGANVTIPNNLSIIVNQSIVPIDTLIIDGSLQIDDSVSGVINFTARRIFIESGIFYFNGTLSDVQFNLIMVSGLYPYAQGDQLNLPNSPLQMRDKLIVASG